MKKIIIEDLIAGILLKFGSCTRQDIELIIEQLKTKYIITYNDLDELKKYIKISKDKISLKNNINLQHIVSDEIINILERIDWHKFILKKIQKQDGIDVNKVDSYFNSEQKRIIGSLVNHGYLAINCSQEFRNNNIRRLNLSENGNLYLFIEDNKEQISQICENIDLNIVYDYLKNQNLTKPFEKKLLYTKIQNYKKAI